jgi:ATP-dependent Clp protease protease subunit
MAAILLAGGTKGKRYGLPHTRIMLHQPWGGMKGTATDISIQAEEILRMKKCLNEILVKHTGQPLKRIEEDVDRDYYMSSQEAKTYGLVDEVIESLRDKKLIVNKLKKQKRTRSCVSFFIYHKYRFTLYYYGRE